MSEDQAPPDQPSDGAPTGSSFGSNDLLLEALAMAADVTEPLVEIGVTLYFGGAVITGILISRAAWMTQWTEMIEQAEPTIGNVIRQALQDGTEGNVARAGAGFLHLRDVTYSNGMLGSRCKLWRGAIDRLNGWSLEVLDLPTGRPPRASS